AMVRRIGVNGGTTDPITTASTRPMSSRRWLNSPATISPTSSAVRSRSVNNRQLTTSSAPSKTPSTMLVLPMSIATSIKTFDTKDTKDRNDRYRRIFLCVLRVHCVDETSEPAKLSRDDPFHAPADPDQQRTI